jgi:hypothetical protein
MPTKLSPEDQAKLAVYTKTMNTPNDADQYFDNLKATSDKAISIAANGAKTPEEQAFVEKNLDPASRGILSGGVIGSVENVGAKSAPGLFNKLKGLMTPEQFVAKEASNPAVQEVLKPPYSYATPAARNPSAIQGIENAVESAAQQQANEAAKASAQHLGEVTAPMTTPQLATVQTPSMQPTWTSNGMSMGSNAPTAMDMLQREKLLQEMNQGAQQPFGRVRQQLYPDRGIGKVTPPK